MINSSELVSKKLNLRRIRSGNKTPNKRETPPILTIDLLCCFLLLGLSTNENFKPNLLIKGTEK